jgi:hypothetical protein
MHESSIIFIPDREIRRADNKMHKIILVGKPEGKEFCRPPRRWEYNTKTETECESL